MRLRLTLTYGALFLVAGLGLVTMTYVLVQQAITPSDVQTFQIGEIEVGQEDPVSVTGDPGAVPPSGAPLERMVEVPRGDSEASSSVAVVDEALDAQAATVLRELVTNSAIALGCMVVVSVGLGWFLAGRILRPLRAVTATVQEISHTNLHRRLAAAGPDDEIKELSDTFDGLLDRLESSFEAQRRFVANASHELRTPLARQRVIAQVALADPDASVDSLREAHERVLVAEEEQERILEALLALARGQRRPEHTENADLAEIAGTVLATTYGDPALQVTVSDALGAAPVRGDVRQIERLVTNLVDNAVVHNIDGGWLEVRTGRRGDRSSVTVTNTGPEIPSEAVGRLLEPFRRLAVDRTSTGRGLGLGLSIVASVAESHDADLQVTPRDGGGLVVTVCFPTPV